MIRYPITREALLDAIERHTPGWLHRAGLRTAGFRETGIYRERTTIWHEVKRVYVRLQHGKCAYCERLIGTDELASVEIHLDHFRPKSCVKQWPAPQHGVTYGFATGGESADRGYGLLAYHPLNYAAACGTCNSPLKADYFPIGAAHRALDGEDPALLAHEEPLLLYPIGDFDDDPQGLIQFIGCVPVPVLSENQVAIRRARVTIDFFRLGPDQGRNDLVQARAVLIRLVFYLLESQKGVAPESERYQGAAREIRRVASAQSPHTNCVRSFLRLFERDPDTAARVYNSCVEYLAETLK